MGGNFVFDKYAYVDSAIYNGYYNEQSLCFIISLVFVFTVPVLVLTSVQLQYLSMIITI